jgi:hypothetical protein
MTLNLSALKKSSSKDLLNKLQKNIEDSSSKKTKEKDTRFWFPEIDAAGNGSAIIRFLPAKNEGGTPYAKTYRHAFEENNMWFIADCPTTLGQKCPVCDSNAADWKLGDAGQKIARARGRGLKYIANVLIIKDPAHPENEGQVKLFKFGKKIMDKIEECFKVDPDLGEEPKNPFNFADGVNFAFRISTVSNFLNFDKSKFVAAPDLYDMDVEKLTELLHKLFELEPFTAPELYKPYDELKARFIKVTTGEDVPVKEQEDKPTKAPSEAYQKPQAADVPADTKVAEKVETPAGSDDDDLAFFRSLVEA